MSKPVHARAYELDKIKKRKNNQFKPDPKMNLSLEPKQIIIDIEVTTLPPLFLFGIKTKY
jgi:hypothetical protein